MATIWLLLLAACMALKYGVFTIEEVSSIAYWSYIVMETSTGNPVETGHPFPTNLTSKVHRLNNNFDCVRT